MFPWFAANLKKQCWVIFSFHRKISSLQITNFSLDNFLLSCGHIWILLLTWDSSKSSGHVCSLHFLSSILSILFFILIKNNSNSRIVGSDKLSRKSKITHLIISHLFFLLLHHLFTFFSPWMTLFDSMSLKYDNIFF